MEVFIPAQTNSRCHRTLGKNTSIEYAI